MPAPSSSPIRPVLAHLAAAADIDRFAGAGVVAVLAKVPDPRVRRGVRRQISAILALAACAVQRPPLTAPTGCGEHGGSRFPWRRLGFAVNVRRS